MTPAGERIQSSGQAGKPVPVSLRNIPFLPEIASCPGIFVTATEMKLEKQPYQRETDRQRRREERGDSLSGDIF